LFGAYKMAAPREVTPIIRWIRHVCLGRYNLKNPLRFKGEQSVRDPPLPVLPQGVSHKLNTNYYYSRDGRGESTRPTLAYEGLKQKAIPSGETSAETSVATKESRPRIPGFGYNPDTDSAAYSKATL
ncbi:unnamed protein product, partial [Owenia fusiformis]